VAETGVRELKIHASEIVRAVRERRARYVITYRGKPVAILAPIDVEAPGDEAAVPDDDQVWDELVRLGEAIGKRPGRTSTVELLSRMRR